MSNRQDVGPTCLYKKGESQVFTGDAVGKAMKEGWKDEPTKTKTVKKTKSNEAATPE